MEKPSDIDIIESVKRGNTADFSILIDRYKDKAFSLLKRMLKNELDAEEVLQDSFFKAFHSLGLFRQEARFSTWFYRIVYNAAITFLTSNRRREEKEVLSLDRDMGLSLADKNDKDCFEALNASQYVNRLIGMLPEKNAGIIYMFYIDEMTLTDISEVTNLSVPNIKVILHRSRTALRELILKYNCQGELS